MTSVLITTLVCLDGCIVRTRTEQVIQLYSGMRYILCPWKWGHQHKLLGSLRLASHLHTLVAGATHCAMPAINRGAASRRPRENSEEADALAKVSGAGTLRAARIISNDHGYLACTGILTRPYISRCGTGSPIHRGMGHPLQTCCHRVSRASCGIQSRPDPPASHAIPLVSTMKLIARNSCFCFCVCLLRVAGCALLRCVVVCAHALICANTYARLQRRAWAVSGFLMTACVSR